MINQKPSFWSLLSAKLTGAGKWLVGAGAAIVVLVSTFVGLYIRKHKVTETTTPSRVQVAQVYEPSISTPLPPDTNSSTTTPSGEVAGDSTSAASTLTPPQTFTAPKSGIDLSEPIPYENSELGFSATLPAKSTLMEKANSVSFFSQSGVLLYRVDVVSSQDNLDTINSELKSSPDVRNITKTNFASLPALQFTTRNSVGYAISKNGKIYYINGNPKFLTDITI